MTYHAQINLIMLATVVGLVTFLYFKPQSEDGREHAISSLAEEAVKSIRIVRHETEMVLKKSDNHWYLVKPLQAKVDKTKVTQILEILSVGSVQRFPLTDLDRFGLDKPNTQLYIDHEYFGFGGLAPITNEQYVATGKNIYLMSPRYAVMLPSQPLDLISTKLLADEEMPVKFEFELFSVRQQAGNWNILSPKPGQVLTQDAINRWLRLWRQADATSLTFHPGDGLVGQTKIKIGLHDGQVINLKILQNESELLFIREDTGIHYHFSVEMGKQLLSPKYVGVNQSLVDN
tara:strand:- start:1626 stop:2492 length:867 start_codon:yes stop_codon:yes gene_type:complete